MRIYKAMMVEGVWCISFEDGCLYFDSYREVEGLGEVILYRDEAAIGLWNADMFLSSMQSEGLDIPTRVGMPVKGGHLGGWQSVLDKGWIYFDSYDRVGRQGYVLYKGDTVTALFCEGREEFLHAAKLNGCGIIRKPT